MTRVHSGEVFRARLDPTEGSEQGKTRPVIVLQNPDLARFTSTALCIPLTTNMKRLGLPGTCFIPKGEAGLGEDGVALAFQMRALDVSRLGKRFGRELMQFDRIELFINIIWRELDMAMQQGDKLKPGMIARLDSIFDGPEWKTEIAATDHDVRAEQCVDLIRKKTGAKWATTIRMLGDNAATRYFLLHLTNNDAGRDLMKEAVWKACPDGGYFARKSDSPDQQMLIMPEPDLAPLRDWVLDRLGEGPRRWFQLHDLNRPQMRLPKHLNEVVRDLRKAKKIEDFDYRGQKHFSPSNNPNLKLRGTT